MKNKAIFIFAICLLSIFTYFFTIPKAELVCSKVESGEIKDSVTGNVHVLAEKTIQLQSNAHGIVSYSALEPLSKSINVEKNQTIIQLDTSDLKRSLEHALAAKKYFNDKINSGSVYELELKIEEDELEAIEELSRLDKISNSELERKKNLVNRLKAKVKQEKISNDQELFNLTFNIQNLKSNIDKMTIRSPIDGELINSYVHAGDIVSTGQKLATIISSKRVIEASLNEEDFYGLKEGLPSAVTLFSQGKKIIETKVSRLSSTVNKSTGRRLLYLELLTPSYNIPMGASGRVEIIKNKKTKALIIPKQSLIGNSVFSVKDGILKIKHVKTGIKNLRTVEIIDGLKEGEIVLNETPHLYKNGDKIAPILLQNNN